MTARPGGYGLRTVIPRAVTFAGRRERPAQGRLPPAPTRPARDWDERRGTEAGEEPVAIGRRVDQQSAGQGDRDGLRRQRDAATPAAIHPASSPALVVHQFGGRVSPSSAARITSGARLQGGPGPTHPREQCRRAATDPRSPSRISRRSVRDVQPAPGGQPAGDGPKRPRARAYALPSSPSNGPHPPRPCCSAVRRRAQTHEPVPATTATPQPSGSRARGRETIPDHFDPGRQTRPGRPARTDACSSGPSGPREPKHGRGHRSRGRPAAAKAASIARPTSPMTRRARPRLVLDGPASPRPHGAARRRPRSPSRATVRVPPPSIPRTSASAVSSGSRSAVTPTAAHPAAGVGQPLGGLVRPTGPQGPATRAVFNSPPQRAAGRPPHRASTPDSCADDAVGPEPELDVGRPQVHHQVAERLAEPDHRAGREHVQHQLGRRARLQPGRAGDHLGPDQRHDHQVDVRRQLGVRLHARPTVNAPDRPGVFDRPQHVRRSPAGGDADDHVLGRRGRAAARSRCGAFAGRPRPPRRPGQRRRAAGDHADDHARAGR